MYLGIEFEVESRLLIVYRGMCLTMQPIDQQLLALNMDIACVVMNTVVIGDLQKVIEYHNSN